MVMMNNNHATEASTGHKFRSIMKYDAECDDPKR